jgi:hypothetical protein
MSPFFFATEYARSVQTKGTAPTYELWNDMDQDMVVKQTGKMKKRLKSTISSRGEWTGD